MIQRKHISKQAYIVYQQLDPAEQLKVSTLRLSYNKHQSGMKRTFIYGDFVGYDGYIMTRGEYDTMREAMAHSKCIKLIPRVPNTSVRRTLLSPSSINEVIPKPKQEA